MKLDKDLIRRGAKYLHDRLTPHVLVLLYHRVIDLPSDPQLLCVTPKHFDQHLEFLHRYAQPITLKDLVTGLQKDKLPRRGIVIAFDDGYFDNLQYAKPLLEKYAIPATVFIAAGQIGRQEEFWWDELERLLLQPGKLPQTLSLRINGGELHWELKETAEYDEEVHLRHCGWHVEQSNDPTPRHQLYRSIYQLLQRMDAKEQRSIIEKLQLWASRDSMQRITHRTLTTDEVILLAQGDLIEIGAHTMSHPLLANLPVSTQRDEIVQSKARLEDLLHQSVDSFAYPYGSYSNETISILREAGFKYACSSDMGAVWRGADPFKIPRVVVRNQDGDGFAHGLKRRLGI